MLFVGLPRYQVTARLPLRKKSNLQARIELSRDTVCRFGFGVGG